MIPLIRYIIACTVGNSPVWLIRSCVLLTRKLVGVYLFVVIRNLFGVIDCAAEFPAITIFGTGPVQNGVPSITVFVPSLPDTKYCSSKWVSPMNLLPTHVAGSRSIPFRTPCCSMPPPIKLLCSALLALTAISSPSNPMS